MTVCIAAISLIEKTDAHDGGYVVIGASDRMITASDIEYEPAQLKSAFLGGRVMALVAGDYQIHSEATYMTMRQLDQTPLATVDEIVALHASKIRAIGARRAEIEILNPLGLTRDTFFRNTAQMDPTLAKAVAKQLLEYRVDAECILAGVDDEGAKMFHVGDDGIEKFANDLGFLVIGGGAWHAQSRLAFAGYQKRASLADALLQVYSAKKAAETAPGVGTVTDMYICTRMGCASFFPHILDSIHKIYEKREKGRARVERAVQAEMAGFVEQILAQPPQQKDGADAAASETRPTQE